MAVEQQLQCQFGAPVHHQSKGINLSMIIDFLLQKTYHDLTVLSELLPRKSDIERKIEIIQFATKTRNQFIRLLALVKWASCADRVDKFQAFSSFLDQQSFYFIDTADTLARIARETLVQARLPIFSLPTAVDVLTTGTFNRLPKCIKTKIIQDEPLKAVEKAGTLKRLNEVIQHRLVVSKVSPQFTNIKIGDGKVCLTVANEFEVSLMLMGDAPETPWRLLNIEFLMEDYQTGGGKSLVHGMQVHYIHQIVQSRLMVEEDPLIDLYNTLHYFCLSLQLEVLHTQSKRLIGMRWGEFVKIDEYIPGQKLILSYCRPSNISQPQQKVPPASPTICIKTAKNDHISLVLHHTPDIFKPRDVTQKPGGLHLSSNCLSIEKIFSCVSKQYAVHQLTKLWTELKSDTFFQNNVFLDENSPFLSIQPFSDCSSSDVVKISLDSRSGKFCINLVDLKLKKNVFNQLQILLHDHMDKFLLEFHKLRCYLYLEKCRRSVLLQPVDTYDKFAISNYDSHLLSRLPVAKLYLKFRKHSDYCLVVTFEVNHSSMDKPIEEKYYLQKLKICNQSSYGNPNVSPDKSTHHFRNGYVADSTIRLDTSKIVKCVTESKSKERVMSPKRKDLVECEFESKQLGCKKRKVGLRLSSSVVTSNEITNVFNSPITSVISATSLRIPYIELCQQLSRAKVTFSGVQESGVNYVMHLLDFPKLTNCKYEDTIALKELLTNCSVYMDMELSVWTVTYYFDKPLMLSCEEVLSDPIEFYYTPCYISGEKVDTYLVDRILADWRGLIKIYEHACKSHHVLTSLKNVSSIDDFSLIKYDMKSLDFKYSPDQCYIMTLSFDSALEKYIIDFSENGITRDKCPHYLTQTHLMNEFNDHNNLQYMLKIVHHTFHPLKALRNIHILPAVAGRVLSVVNNFTIIAHSSTYVKVIYRNIYILDVYFMESSVVIRDGTFYRTDSTKAMRGFSRILKLTSFLELFADKMQSNGFFIGQDNPITPGGVEFDQQSEHFSPASNDSMHQQKDRPIKSPALAISSPSQPYQFAAQSPGNPISVPSPGTFLQPSPAPQTIPIMSPSSWPGSPPYIQGSPRPGKGTSQSRQLLSSISITHTPVPVLLTHSGFKMMLKPVENSPACNAKSPKVCRLESFFGSISLRTQLIRVIKADDTLKLEKDENDVVIFSGTGKNGPEPGLQYSVHLNPNTMDSLVLKITPLKESMWLVDDFKVLEHFFEYKVVRSPHKPGALTAFIRILGAQPKLIKDFIRIMRLELQTDWTGFLFKVEWCLTIPPSDKPFIALPGTPAVVLRNKNLIYLQLTEVANENNTVTVTLVHDMKKNDVQHLEFRNLANAPPEPVTWAVRARVALQSLLQKIAEHIPKKECPIYCAVITILKKMEVK